MEKRDIDMLPHTPGKEVKENEILPTCGNVGGYDLVTYCTACQSEISRRNVELSKLAHEFGEWQVTKEPTCAQKGEEKRVCANDSTHVEKRDIDMLPHTPGKEVKENEILPTCTKEGSYDMVVRCDVCTQILSSRNIVIPKVSHTPSNEWEISKAPTCLDNGVEINKCAICDQVIDSRVTPCLGHNYSPTWTIDIEATCEYPGSKSNHCTRCGDKINITTIAALGHDYGHWVVSKKPTIYTTGILTKQCNRDKSHCETFTLPVLNNVDYEYYHTLTPTCSNNGQDQYKYLKDGDVFTFTTSVSKIPHTIVTVKGREATCTETGLTDGKKCSVCGTITEVQKTIPALGHDFTTSECSRCKAILDGYTAIRSELDLRNVESNMNGNYVLLNDITLNKNWASLGRSENKIFKGVFDGNNHSIIGLSGSNTDCGGLFYENAGTIKNVCLSNPSFNIDYYEDKKNQMPSYGNVSADFGGIAARNSGTIQNCKITGKITITTSNTLKLWFDSIGGGTDYRKDFYNSYRLGGISAVNKGTISNCIISADFEYSCTNYMGSSFGLLGGFEIGGFYLHSDVSAGGITGDNQGLVKNCTMQGNCKLNSNQTADSWKKGQPRTVGVSLNCNFGSLIGINQSEVVGCYGTVCTINKNHQVQGETKKASCDATINNAILSGIIGYNTSSGRTSNCGVR